MKQWFIINTLTGQEQKVQRLIASTASAFGPEKKDLSPFIGDIRVPTDPVTVVPRNDDFGASGGKKARKSSARVIQKKRFPGYVFLYIDLYLDDHCRHLNNDLWQFVNLLDGVIGFLGAEKNSRGEMLRAPLPVSDAEMQGVLNNASADVEKVNGMAFAVGDVVKIMDGPFMSSVGTVQIVDANSKRLTVSVSLFGSETPVELQCYQVEKYEPEDEDGSAK